MMPAANAPDRGGLVWLEFTPRAGNAQAGRRPGLVVSPKSDNRKVDLALVCPITSKVKGYPFGVELPTRLAVQGAILWDQVKCLDWRARKATQFGSVREAVMAEVTARIVALVDPDE